LFYIDGRRRKVRGKLFRWKKIHQIDEGRESIAKLEREIGGSALKRIESRHPTREGFHSADNAWLGFLHRNNRFGNEAYYGRD